MVSKSLSTAFAGLALLSLGATSNAQTVQQVQFQKTTGPLGKAHYNLETGELKVLQRPNQAGQFQVNPTRLAQNTIVNGFLNNITTGFFTGIAGGDEFMDWATKSSGGTGIVKRFAFGYATTATDTTAGGAGQAMDISFYEGTTGFCVLGTESGRFSFTGLPGVTGTAVGTGAAFGFTVTATIADGAEICLADGAIGFSYVNTDGNTAGPLLTDNTANTGNADAFDIWSPAPASTGTCVGSFFFGGCITPVPPPPSGTPCADFFMEIATEDGASPASSVVRNGSGANPLGYAQLPNTAYGTFGPGIASDYNTLIDIVTPGAVASAQQCSTGSLPGIPLGLGELLVDPGGLIGGADIAAGSHSLPVPKDLSLLGLTFFCQGATINVGPIDIQLQNALDVTFGF